MSHCTGIFYRYNKRMDRILRLIGWAALAMAVAGCGAAGGASGPAGRAAPTWTAAPTDGLPAETASRGAAAAEAGPVDATPGTPRPATGPTLASTVAALLPTPSAFQARLEGLDAFLADQASTKGFSGAVLVGEGGAIRLSEGYGLADAGHDLANTPQTRFMIASLTKQFTATAVLMLEARHKLDVRDPLCSYIKGCPPAWKAVTIHQLLTHTSGIPDFFGFDDFNARRALPMTPAQMVAWIKDKPLNFTPGKLYSYSNSGYNLLGYLIEQVSGQTYAAFLKQNIFDPLKMANSAYDRTAPDVAIGYHGAGVKADFTDPSILFAAGGLYSSVEDLYRWDQALYTHELLPQELLDEMFRPQVELPNQSGVSYGYGWVITTLGQHRLVHHEGIIDGYHTTIQRFPDERLTLIVLSNQDDFDINTIKDQAFQAMFP
jgi:CubicO group peptidase (beta-lactamase class C family)